MDKLLVIIKREYLTRIRSKTFIIGTIITPLVMVALVVFPAMLAVRGGGERQLTVLDQSGDAALYTIFNKKLNSPPPEIEIAGTRQGPSTRFTVKRVEVPPDKNVDELREELDPQLEQKAEQGCLVLRPGVLDNVEPEYYAKNLADFSIRQIERAISAAVVERRLVKAGVDAHQADTYIKPVDLKTLKPRGKTEEGGFTAFMVPYIMLIFTYLTVFMYGIAMMRGVIEEKQSRIVEIVVSSVKPTHLMMGKLLGIGCVGLTQVLIWSASFMAISAGGATMLGAGASRLPRVPFSLIVYFVAYFILGYFLYSALYAIVGTMASTEEDAQHVQMPVTMLIVVPMVLFVMIMNNPNSAASVALSLVPFFAPTLMMLRIAIVNPPMWQVLGSMALMVVFIFGAVWMAAKIYRVGILMYGKRPSIAELGRWLRYT
jgi:ABC-2 type transport system permease protein